MSRENTLVLLGALVVLAPFSGLPLSILSFLLPAIGLLIALIGALSRPRRRAAPAQSHEASSEASA